MIGSDDENVFGKSSSSDLKNEYKKSEKGKGNNEKKGTWPRRKHAKHVNESSLTSSSESWPELCVEKEKKSSSSSMMQSIFETDTVKLDFPFSQHSKQDKSNYMGNKNLPTQTTTVSESIYGFHNFALQSALLYNDIKNPDVPLVGIINAIQNITDKKDKLLPSSQIASDNIASNNVSISNSAGNKISKVGSHRATQGTVSSTNEDRHAIKELIPDKEVSREDIMDWVVASDESNRSRSDCFIRQILAQLYTVTSQVLQNIEDPIHPELVSEHRTFSTMFEILNKYLDG